MSSERVVLLNGAVIRRRRFELGLSERSLAKPLGVSSATIARIEDGTNHKDLPLGLVVRMADELGLSLGDVLLVEEPDDAHSPENMSNDAARLGALLWETSTATPLSAITEVLGWTLEHARDAIKALDALLRPAGLRVQMRNSEVRLERRLDAAGELEVKALLRRHQARRGLGLSEARVLADLLAGRLDTTKLSNPNQVALARLANAGLVELEDEPRVSEDLDFGLPHI